jgi:surfeit locus 1 family protein
VTPLWRRPIWLLGHLIALTAVLLFVRAGFWQIDRLHQKQARNRLEAARSDGPALDIATVDTARAQYQRVRARGHFVEHDQVLIRNWSQDGAPGQHVVTPFVYADGVAVLVNRGWIPLATAPPAPPSGTVTIEGLLLQTQVRTIGPKDADTGRLAVLNRLDVQRVQRQVDVRLFALYLQQTRPPIPAGSLPIRLDPPPRDEGPHRSYAIQWFFFALVVIVGYPLLMRRRAREQEADDLTPDSRDPIAPHLAS